LGKDPGSGPAVLCPQVWRRKERDKI
jgi:hypothetical protein